MTTLYVCGIRTIVKPSMTAVWPDIPDSALVSSSTLALDKDSNRALVISEDDTLSGQGESGRPIRGILTAQNVHQLVVLAKMTRPTSTQRNAVANYLSNNGYDPLPISADLWIEVIHFVARQVTWSADLNKIGRFA